MLIFRTLEEYLANSSFHGLRFIGEEGRHWTERLFWIVCVALSWMASGVLMLAAWDAFQNNAISFVVDTSYKDWNNRFPSITVCETENAKLVTEASVKYWGDSSYSLDLEAVISIIAFFKGNGYIAKEYCYKDSELIPEMNCPTEDLARFAPECHKPCEEMIYRCHWLGKEFDCCKHFLPIDTEFGRCFSINNLQTNATNFSKLKTYSNLSTGPGNMRIEVKGSAIAYITSPEDIPSLNTEEIFSIKLEENIVNGMRVAIKEVDNEAEVRDVSIEQRKCRFPEENDILKVFKKYSTGTCLVECRRDNQLKRCNCSNHVLPRTDPKTHCNLQGIVCLTEYYGELVTQKNAWSKKEGLFCPQCVAACSEMEIRRVDSLTTKLDLEDRSIFVLSLDQLPTEKLIRVVVRGALDLVVSMGGTAGLFVGASLLSFVELFYYFTMRMCSNYYRSFKNTRSTVANNLG